jgi:hypothetical protein
MNDYQLTWYLQEIAMHAYGAEVDMKCIDELLDKPETIQSRLVWFHLSSFLSHVAMISKLVSPISRDVAAKSREAGLKTMLNIAANSEVLPRNARDNTEHFDERIDNWVSANATAILEMVLPDRDGYNYLQGAEKRVRRVLLKQEYIYISENRDGTKFELALRPLFNEVKHIGDKATKWINTKSPYTFIYPRVSG